MWGITISASMFSHLDIRARTPYRLNRNTTKPKECQCGNIVVIYWKSYKMGRRFCQVSCERWNKEIEVKKNKVTENCNKLSSVLTRWLSHNIHFWETDGIISGSEFNCYLIKMLGISLVFNCVKFLNKFYEKLENIKYSISSFLHFRMKGLKLYYNQWSEEDNKFFYMLL